MGFVKKLFGQIDIHQGDNKRQFGNPLREEMSLYFKCNTGSFKPVIGKANNLTGFNLYTNPCLIKNADEQLESEWGDDKIYEVRAKVSNVDFKYKGDVSLAFPQDNKVVGEVDLNETKDGFYTGVLKITNGAGTRGVSFRNGIRHGREWGLKEEVNWNNGVKDGYEKFKDGGYVNWANGVKHGKEFEVRISQTVNMYKDGKLHGECFSDYKPCIKRYFNITTYDEGKLVKQVRYEFVEDILHGTDWCMNSSGKFNNNSPHNYYLKSKIGGNVVFEWENPSKMVNFKVIADNAIAPYVALDSEEKKPEISCTYKRKYMRV